MKTRMKSADDIWAQAIRLVSEQAKRDYANKTTIMYYETNCTSCGSIDRWNTLMKGARKCSYKRLVARIKKELPDLYKELRLDFYNPWEESCQQTKTHYILVHSSIEYFIHK